MKTRDLFVVGCGLAGAAAALFAARRGLSVTQAGGTAEIVYASGLFDVYDAPDPWAALERLRARRPQDEAEGRPLHPYARLRTAEARRALEEFLDWLGRRGLPYRHNGDAACRVLTPAGGLKRTWAVPATMWPGVEAAAAKSPALLVDFHGLREYSAAQIAAVAGRTWPGLRAARVHFPAPAPHPLLPGVMAQALELPAHRASLAEAIRPLLRGETHVGLPAVLGSSPAGVDGGATGDLAARLGVSVFEIPTLPASVPGMRLKAVLENGLEAEGVDARRLTRARAVLPTPLPDGPHAGEAGFRVELDGPNTRPDNSDAEENGIEEDEEHVVYARQVLLATGRFIGRGLRAERDGVRERLMDLPVFQPPSREQWHSPDLFDPAGHPVDRAGIVVDDAFRPVDITGKVVRPGLYAAGTILAHQDWLREKCGAGLAVATAWAAVAALAPKAGRTS